MAGAAHAHNPLAQFQVYPIVPLRLGHYDISFTNASLWMLIVSGSVLLIMSAGAARRALVPGRMQSFAETLIDFVGATLTDMAGPEAMRYFPAVFTLFMFVLFANLAGMAPYSFTVTSHIIITFAMAAIVFTGVTGLAVIRHGPVKFIHFFLPEGIPLIMLPLMFVIELMSYLARPLSLALRLAINMVVGHTLMKVIAGFVFMLGLWGVFPLAFLVLFTGLEIGIALLQAYIFTILTCVYLNDALHLH
ncbi:MAG: F0F1 ATP synthase subunit A [Alphaproteobacteria bacterium]|nr:F0F1 ATP synthase subunit A [Alphaproteobacteria bacterium]